MRWCIAEDADVVHDLVLASDREAARRTGTAAPVRRRESSLSLVGSGETHVGLLGGRAVVTVTVSARPPYPLEGTGLPPAERPRYLRRLAVDPGAGLPLLGLVAVRYACEVARAAGADMLRAEANPDLEGVLRLLEVVGFVRCGTDESGPAPRTYLSLPLSPPG